MSQLKSFLITKNLLLLIVIFALTIARNEIEANKITDHKIRKFEINYRENTFLKDGQNFRYISGSFHYFRSVKEHWNDIFIKFKLAGLNAVQTYVEWASHQPSPEEKYNFDGNLNIFEFIELAQKNDLLVILRPGPYIDAERDMGGLPPWLLWQKENISLRSSDLEYNFFVSRWFDYLLPLIKPYLYENGGPIIMVQVENEYGSFGCDKNYTIFLRDLFRFHLGSNVVLFTTDGAADYYLKCGVVPNVYPTVDFGPGSLSDVTSFFNFQRNFTPIGGPLVNSEYYSGWLDHWGKPHSVHSTKSVAKTLNDILDQGASVNIYLFYGGTSFGYSSGSNIDQKFEVCPTSYDYDAPISEARDPTEKYFEIKKVISRFTPVPEENPQKVLKASYGKVEMMPFSSILDSSFLKLVLKGEIPIDSLNPLSFEELKISYGFILYETIIDFMTTDPVLLSLSFKDRAYVYVNFNLVGVLSRTENIYSLPISLKKGSKISILVENQGRPCYGSQIGESKGLGKNVTLGLKQLQNWKNFRLGDINESMLSIYAEKQIKLYRESKYKFPKQLSLREGSGNFYYGTFVISNSSYNASEGLLDTFVRLDGWTKGVIWINGFNLGRYWPVIGPQVTLYLPGPLLKPPPNVNRITIFELQKAPDDCIPSFSNMKKNEPLFNGCNIYLTDSDEINGPTPYTSFTKYQNKISYRQTVSMNDITP